jgi:four helix bundle protein
VKENIALDKSKAFAIRIINLYRYLCDTRKEYVLSKQLLRSGTSIGANLSESVCAISRKDFASKVYIALKECSETSYWLELLYETDYLTEEEYTSINSDCRELLKLLMATTKALSKDI